MAESPHPIRHSGGCPSPQQSELGRLRGAVGDANQSDGRRG